MSSNEVLEIRLGYMSARQDEFRKDVLELREDIRSLRGRIDAMDAALSKRIDANDLQLGRRIDAIDLKLGKRIDAIDLKLL